MAYLGKHGLYRLCSFSALSGGILELLLERCCIILIVMLVKRKKKKKKIKPGLALLVAGHIYCWR